MRKGGYIDPFHRSSQAKVGSFTRTSNPSLLKVPPPNFNRTTIDVKVPNQLPSPGPFSIEMDKRTRTMMMNFSHGYDIGRTWGDEKKSLEYLKKQKDLNKKVIDNFKKNQELVQLMKDVENGKYNTISHLETERDSDLPNISVEELTAMLLTGS